MLTYFYGREINYNHSQNNVYTKNLARNVSFVTLKELLPEDKYIKCVEIVIRYKPVNPLHACSVKERSWFGRPQTANHGPPSIRPPASKLVRLCGKSRRAAGWAALCVLGR